MKLNPLFILVIFISFFHENIFSQNCYYDALKIKAIIRDGSITPETPQEESMWNGIASKYNLNSDNYLNNPFIKEYLKGAEITPSGNLMANNVEGKYNSFISSVGGLDVTKLADGMAKFLVERVKQELSLAFFDQFKTDIEQNKDLQVLFPNTTDALMVIDNEIYNYSAYLEMLREAFLKDFELIIPDIRQLALEHKEYFKTNKPLGAILSVALQIVDEYQRGIHPGDIIAHLSVLAPADLNPIDPNLKPTLEVLNLFIQSIRSKQYNLYAVPYDSIRINLFGDPVAFNFFIGLVYQLSKTHQIKIEGKDFADTYLNPGDIEKIKSLISDIAYKAELIQLAMQTIKDKNKEPGNKAVYNDYYVFYNASLELIKLATKIPEDFFPDYKLENYDKLFFIADKTGEIYLDASQNRYTSVIVNLAIVYDSIFPTNQNISEMIIKYGNFAAIIAKAETSDDIKNAIEAVALPAGSSRIKRETNFNVSLNAYCGLFAGQNITILSSTPYSYGVTAPIGITTSWGRCHNSYSIFASAIDLGSVTAFRFKNDSVQTLQKIELKDIISPGLFFSWGIPKCPISLNLGCQLAPLLTSVSASENTFDESILRFTIGVCVDIPLVNFYTKPKK
jgi:hypothetical protein